jgi:hypothetical protein
MKSPVIACEPLDDVIERMLKTGCNPPAPQALNRLYTELHRLTLEAQAEKKKAYEVWVRGGKHSADEAEALDGSRLSSTDAQAWINVAEAVDRAWRTVEAILNRHYE